VTPKFDRAGRSRLFYAAIEGRAGDVAAYLQDHGDEVNSADGEEAGAELNARNSFGNNEAP
jgi:ankyrin repeat protein